jgi:hypothetical protein
MNRNAKLVLTAAQLAALHHFAIDLAQKRGVRRVPVYRVIQEAIIEYLRARGVEVREEFPSLGETVEAP